VLGLSGDKPIIVLRTEETYASYLLGYSPPHGSGIVSVARELLSALGGEIELVVLPRYESQISELKATLPEEVRIAEHVIDAPSLLALSSVFVGGGGTMTAEAALLGVPSISCHPRENLVELFLARSGLLRRISDPAEIRMEVLKILESPISARTAQEERAASILAKMEDPVEVIYRTILNLLGEAHSMRG